MLFVKAGLKSLPNNFDHEFRFSVEVFCGFL